MRGWEKIFYENGNEKKAGIAVLVSDKIQLKTKSINRDKEGCYIKRLIQERDIILINIYTPI